MSEVLGCFRSAMSPWLTFESAVERDEYDRREAESMNQYRKSIERDYDNGIMRYQGD